jgi:ABC-type transporter Mla MlaB component
VSVLCATVAASEPSPVVLVLGGPIVPADIPVLCSRARALLEGSDAGLVVCDVGGLLQADAVTVEALVRLRLTARRLGRRMCLRDAPAELQDLLAFVGLDDVVPSENGAMRRVAEAGRRAGTTSPCRGRR